MATVLILSSQVARGYVGGSAARIALERLGHAVWLLPTVILSNHPGHALFAGEQVPPGRLKAMVEALEGNGWLEEVDAVMTGYMPTEEHVSLAAHAIRTCLERNPDLLVLNDPIIGDDPGGLYLDEEIADAIRDLLLPLSNIATPNRFELEWLTGLPATTPSEAVKAAQSLEPKEVLATSVPGMEPEKLVNLLVTKEAAWQTQVTRRDAAPHGTGDVAAALYLGHRLNGAPPNEALSLATAGLEAVLDHSADSDELNLIAAQNELAATDPWPLQEVRT